MMDSCDENRNSIRGPDMGCAKVPAKMTSPQKVGHPPPGPLKPKAFKAKMRSPIKKANRVVKMKRSTANATSDVAGPVVVKKANKKLNKFPGTIGTWLQAFTASRPSSEIVKMLFPQISFYCHTNDSASMYRPILVTEPTKFCVMYCLRALTSPDPDSDANKLQGLLKLRALFELYSNDLSLFYDPAGFQFLISGTIQALDPDPMLGLNKTTTTVSGIEEWSQLSTSAKSIVFAARIWFLIVFKEELSKVVPLVRALVDVEDSVPEWHYLQCLVFRLRRHASNIPIVKPMKGEMTALRTAFDLEPGNVRICLLFLWTLWDWMRTDDRKPCIEVWGENLTDVQDIAQLIHSEIRDLVSRSDLPLLPRLDLYYLASCFYGYKNLPRICIFTPRREDGPDISYCSTEDELLFHYDPVSKEEAAQLSEYYLKGGLSSSPSSEFSLLRALKYLREFCRAEALSTLSSALESNPWDETIVLTLVRVLIGGSVSEQDQALTLIDQYIRISGVNRWAPLFQVHLYFLKGCVFWLRNEIKQCIAVWIQGLYISEKDFLNQFAFWSKTQSRKYLWPDSFTSFGMIARLQEALQLLSMVSEETFEDPRIPSASAAFLAEIELFFPASWKVATEISSLSKRWFYLIESSSKYAGSSSEDEEEDDDDEEEEEEEEEEDDEIEIMDVVSRSVPGPSIEYMDLDGPSLLLPERKATVSDKIRVNILPTFYMEPIENIPQLQQHRPPVFVTLDDDEEGSEVLADDEDDVQVIENGIEEDQREQTVQDECGNLEDQQQEEEKAENNNANESPEEEQRPAEVNGVETTEEEGEPQSRKNEEEPMTTEGESEESAENEGENADPEEDSGRMENEEEPMATEEKSEESAENEGENAGLEEDSGQQTTEDETEESESTVEDENGEPSTDDEEWGQQTTEDEAEEGDGTIKNEETAQATLRELGLIESDQEEMLLNGDDEDEDLEMNEEEEEALLHGEGENVRKIRPRISL